MKITEITAPYSNPYSPEVDIGLMTKNEFLSDRNVSGKSHPDAVYQTSLSSLNTESPWTRYDISFMSRMRDELYLLKFPGGWLMTDSKPSIYSSNLDKNSVIAVIFDDTVYYNKRFSKSFLPINYSPYPDVTINLSPKNRVEVKYLNSYIDKLTSRSEQNVKDYPKVIKRFSIGNEKFTIRMKNIPTTKDSGESIVIMNDSNNIVAYASDEWGATLLRVVDEYRGKNIGQILGNLWYSFNPGYSSGGFSPSGRKNAVRIWENRVREFLSNGWYSEFVKTGVMTKDRVKQIVGELPERKKIMITEPKTTKPEPLFYSDGDNMFVVYDKKFFEDQDEKYIYAYGFLRDFDGKLFAYALDYDPPYKKLATIAIVQLAQDFGSKLYVAGKPSDIIDLSGIPEIKQENGYAYLDRKTIDIKQLSSVETAYRKQRDRYGEILQLILEFAHSKW
jgi:hypothetical protein